MRKIAIFILVMFFHLPLAFAAGVHTFLSTDELVYKCGKSSCDTLIFYSYFEPAPWLTPKIAELITGWQQAKKEMNLYADDNYTTPKLLETCKDISCENYENEGLENTPYVIKCEAKTDGYFEKSGVKDAYKDAIVEIRFVLESGGQKEVFKSKWLYLSDAVFFEGEEKDGGPVAEDASDDSDGDDGVSPSAGGTGQGQSSCASDLNSPNCDADGDKIFGSNDKCPLDAEIYLSNGITPADSYKDGCPNSAPMSSSTGVGLQGSGSGAKAGCSLVMVSTPNALILAFIIIVLMTFLSSRLLLRAVAQRTNNRF